MNAQIRVAIASASLAGAIGGCSPSPRSHAIVMRNFGFDPPTVTVAVGDTVSWQNADLVPHTATARDAAWDSKTIGADGAWHVITTAPGTHDYYCVFHPGMKGTVIVR